MKRSELTEAKKYLLFKAAGIFALCIAAALLVFAYSSGKLPGTDEADDAFSTVYAYENSQNQ